MKVWVISSGTASVRVVPLWVMLLAVKSYARLVLLRSAVGGTVMPEATPPVLRKTVPVVSSRFPSWLKEPLAATGTAGPA